MTNLILTICAIALTAALSVATISYLPTWQSAAEETFALSKHAFYSFEKAYKLYAAFNADTPAEVLVGPDGGLQTNFSSYYSFLPKAPYGYAWKYGRNDTLGLDFFCMFPINGAQVTFEGTWRGLQRLKRIVSDEQLFLTEGGEAVCGQSVNSAQPTDFPASITATFFVRYIPE